MKKIITIFGYQEAELEEKLSFFPERFKKIKLKIVKAFPEIHIEMKKEVENGSDRLLEDGIEWISKRMGNRIISPDGLPMEAVVGNLLRNKKASLAVAESCTGGLISHKLTNVAGSSDYFLFSAVTYSNQAKKTILGVSQEVLEKYGAVHEETAMEMAAGVRRMTGADFGLSTTGIAGPGGGTKEKPVGTVCVGVASSDRSVGSRFFFPDGDRSMNKEYFAMSALDLLRTLILRRK